METVLIQDRDKDILEILTTALELENFNVYTVMEQQDDLLNMIDNLRPHVVVLDYRMEGKDCVAICRAIKARYPHLPVVAMSCNSNIHEVYDRHGFDDYIPKPFDLEQLYQILRKHIHQHTVKP
jgi:DNA-binding NtrC family response regulator